MSGVVSTNSQSSAVPSGGPRVRPRASFGGALWTLYTLTLRQHARGRRWLVMALLFLLPAGLAMLIRGTAPQTPYELLEFLLAWMFIPQALLPLVALMYASGIIQDEQEEQTLTYLLVRPIPKWAIYVVKMLATLTTTTVLAAVFTMITYAAIFAGSGVDSENVAARCAVTVRIHVLAVVAYCCLFGLLSLITKRTLVIGIVYIAVVEGVLANLPFGVRLATVIYYTRVIAYRTMEFIHVRSGGSIENLGADAWQFDIRKDPDLLTHPQSSTCYLVLLGASVVCTLLAAMLCSQREFHVKTPEKD